MSEKDLLSGLSLRLRIAWTVWGIVGVVLFGASIKFREANTVTSLAEELSGLRETSQQQYESLLRELRKRPVYQLGSIPLPAPDPGRRLGWPGAVVDTTGASSLESVDADAADSIFSRVPEGRSLVNYVITGEVLIESLRLTTPNPSIPKSGGPPRYRVDLIVKNLRSLPLPIDIPRGQVFENTDRRVKLQNLVVAESAARVLPPGSPVRIQLPAYCLNEGFGRPSGQDGNITPLQIRFEFRDQDALWSQVARAIP